MRRLTDADRFRDLLGRATLDELNSMKARLDDAVAFRFPAPKAATPPKKRGPKPKANSLPLVSTEAGQ